MCLMHYLSGVHHTMIAMLGLKVFKYLYKTKIKKFKLSRIMEFWYMQNKHVSTIKLLL